MSTITISTIEGTSQWLDGGAMFGNAPKTLWERWHAPDELSRIKLSCRAMLIEIDNIKVLCETGIGSFFEPKMAKRFGIESSEHILIQNLAQKQIHHEEKKNDLFS